MCIKQFTHVIRTSGNAWRYTHICSLKRYNAIFCLFPSVSTFCTDLIPDATSLCWKHFKASARSRVNKTRGGGSVSEEQITVTAPHLGDRTDGIQIGTGLLHYILWLSYEAYISPKLLRQVCFPAAINFQTERHSNTKFSQLNFWIECRLSDVESRRITSRWMCIICWLLSSFTHIHQEKITCTRSVMGSSQWEWKSPYEYEQRWFTQ